jgi:hypothetical protein
VKGHSIADRASPTPQSLRRIADALLDRAEQGNLPSAREIVLTEGLRRQLTFTIFRTSES